MRSTVNGERRSRLGAGCLRREIAPSAFAEASADKKGARTLMANQVRGRASCN